MKFEEPEELSVDAFSEDDGERTRITILIDPGTGDAKYKVSTWVDMNGDQSVIELGSVEVSRDVYLDVLATMRLECALRAADLERLRAAADDQGDR